MLYHVQALDTSVEVVCAVILAEGYGGSSQEGQVVANSENSKGDLL